MLGSFGFNLTEKKFFNHNVHNDHNEKQKMRILASSLT